MGEGQVVMGSGMLALSGWVACVMTIVLQVAYYNRFFGRIEADLATAMKSTDKAHMRLDIIHAEAQEKIEALREKVHPLSRPCADLVELQTMISGQLATLASDSKNLKTAVEKLQSQVEKLHDKK